MIRRVTSHVNYKNTEIFPYTNNLRHLFLDFTMNSLISQLISRFQALQSDFLISGNNLPELSDFNDF